MLSVDTSTIDFLVTDTMAEEARHLLDTVLPALDSEFGDRWADIRRVRFVACGSPLCACQTAALLFKRYSSVPCTADSGQDFLDQPWLETDGSTLVVGVTDSGTTSEVVESLARARREGALTMAVTKSAESPAGEAAEFAIAYEGAAIWSLHLLSAYHIAIRVIQANGGHPEIDRIVADLPKVPGVLRELVASQEPRAKELAVDASSWPFIYTVSAGNLLPLGYKEGVVTMLEFTWTHGAALNAAEFRHGPIEVVDREVPYLVLIGNDESRATTERCLRFLNRHSDRVVVFDVRDLGTNLHPALDPIVLFVPLEYFFLWLSLGKDHNPDDRRHYGGLSEY